MLVNVHSDCVFQHGPAVSISTIFNWWKQRTANNVTQFCVCCGRGARTLASKSVGRGHGLVAVEEGSGNGSQVFTASMTILWLISLTVALGGGGSVPVNANARLNHCVFAVLFIYFHLLSSYSLCLVFMTSLFVCVHRDTIIITHAADTKRSTGRHSLVSVGIKREKSLSVTSSMLTQSLRIERDQFQYVFSW